VVEILTVHWHTHEDFTTT